jgi:MinD superfamily P-loop ATPase
MKEIVIISGKGGTGKTSLTASFAILGGEKIVLADCDVDAADLHLLMAPDFAISHDFYSGLLAIIDENRCNNCGICADVCRFDAITVIENQYIINDLDCEGCGYCSHVCPEDAIRNEERYTGQWYVSKTRLDSMMVHACLEIGAENSGKLVAQVKNEAKKIALEKNKDIVLVDGSPGIGCPVISSLSGASFVVIVTEPTVSGLHDLMRVVELAEKFNLRCGCILNKSDLNPGMTKNIEIFLKQRQIPLICNLPYDDAFTRAIIKGKTVIENGNNYITKIISDCWKKIEKITFTEG